MPAHRVPFEVSLWAKVEKTDSCWIWTGARSASGYGSIGARYPDRRMFTAHRIVYELLIGPIPEGLTLDHLCCNKACVNPNHLEPVTSGENTRRAQAAHGILSGKTHCPQNHPYDEANTRLSKSNRRYCRTCERARGRRRRNSGVRCAS